VSNGFTELMIVVEWIISISLLIIIVTYRQTVKGTRLRYLLKSWLILLLVLGIIACVIRKAAEIYVNPTDISLRLWSTVSVLWVVLILGFCIFKLLTEDDDDWFNDRRKKLKRWYKNFRNRRVPRPVSVT
jgi:hypothetical protein